MNAFGTVLIFCIALIPPALAYVGKRYFGRDITILEMCAQAVIGVVAVIGIWIGGNNLAVRDTEILNGVVTRTEVRQMRCYRDGITGCTQSYPCDFYRDSRGNSRHHTCYRYPWERNYEVYSNTDDGEDPSLLIDRVDPQGRNIPPRWVEIQPGDPFSRTNHYSNWVRAARDSLFHREPMLEERYADLLVDYPEEIYDYYRIDRVVAPNVQMDEDLWNREITRILSTLGPTRQMNLIVVVTEGTGLDYAAVLQHHWYGFRKNDAVLMIGLNNGAIAWADVRSWSKEARFDIELRNYVSQMAGTNLSAIDVPAFMNEVNRIGDAYFVRRPMAEFEYLRSDIPPPWWLILASIAFSIVFSVVASYYFAMYDPFNPDTWN